MLFKILSIFKYNNLAEFLNSARKKVENKNKKPCEIILIIFKVKNKNKPPHYLASLRQQVEELLKNRPTKTASQLSEADIVKLLYELEVHQIEIEIQNEELIRAKDLAESTTEKFTNLYDFAPTGYFTLSQEGNILNLNLWAAQMLGKERTSLISSRFALFISDDTKPIFNNFFDKIFRSAKKESCEVTLAINSSLPIYAHLTGINTGNGEQCYVTAVDITERKQAEHALRNSEEQRNSILNDVTDVVWSLSWPDMKVNFISPSVEQVYGRPVREFIENPSLWAGTVHPDDKHISDKAFEQLNIEGSAVRECRIIRPDGSIVWINDKSKIIFDHNGMPIRIDGVSRDITGRKLAEEELRISEGRYRLLAENTRDVVYTMNLDGTITYVSPAVVLLRGLTVEEAMHQPLYKILTPESQVISVDYVKRLCSAIESGSPLPTFHGELEYYRKDGSILLTESFTYPVVESDGATITMLGVTRDISERKKTEQEIKLKNEELKELNAQKDKFFSIIAHDLKSPFNAILGFSEMLKDEARDLDIDSIVQYAGIINSSALHAFELLENLLEWARMQQGRIPFEPVTLLLNTVIHSEFEVLMINANQKNISLIDGIHENIVLTADENMLRTVIRNLISNAIKFTAKNGKVQLDAQIQDNRVVISVSDTGIGMKKETIENLFKIETSFTTRGTENEKGTGLGLLLCLEFIGKHGGKIWVESEPGKGSTFSFNLPEK